VLVRALAQSGFSELPVTAAHAARVAGLPAIHRDPFDRLLVAQSLAEPMTLSSRMTRYWCATVRWYSWCDVVGVTRCPGRPRGKT